MSSKLTRNTPKDILVEVLEESLKDHAHNYFISDAEVESITKAYMEQLELRVMSSTSLEGVVQILVSDIGHEDG